MGKPILNLRILLKLFKYSEFSIVTPFDLLLKPNTLTQTGSDIMIFFRILKIV